MKTKTIEEKRAAVLAYCEKVCPTKGFEYFFDWGKLINWGDYWTAHNKVGSCLFSTELPTIQETGQFYNFPLAYLIFGLETRYAVEAERANSAALVESLEEAYSLFHNDDSGFIRETAQEWGKVLEAHKKGGEDGK